MTMAECRQPLSVLATRPSNAVNVMPQTPHLTPGKSVKRTNTSAGLDVAAIKLGTVTPTKASAVVTATNGRRSVKRVRTDVADREDSETARQRAELENTARIKVWCEQYKKVFPSLRFFFDNCSDEDVRRCTRKINHLRGFVEPFFSKTVNVVVTTRDIPKAQTLAPLRADSNSANIISTSIVDLQRNSAASISTTVPPPTFRSFGQNKLAPRTTDLKEITQSHDILVKAQTLGMKIWSLKKLKDSVLKNLLADQDPQTNSRTLSNTLRNEKFLGAFEENVVQFKGPYLLVRDMNEVCRPIMCKEWANVLSAKDGDWPQWRVTRLGKCPFVRDSFAEKHKDHSNVTQVRPERGPLTINHLQHANASGIQQITSAIQSNWGKSLHSGKENIGSGIANLHKKAVTAKRSTKLNPNVDPTDSKKVKVDIKAGFCENCREKFDDFDLHLRSRTHRTYAKNEENFVELDYLLHSLARTIRPDVNDTT